MFAHSMRGCLHICAVLVTHSTVHALATSCYPSPHAVLAAAACFAHITQQSDASCCSCCSCACCATAVLHVWSDGSIPISCAKLACCLCNDKRRWCRRFRLCWLFISTGTNFGEFGTGSQRTVSRQLCTWCNQPGKRERIYTPRPCASAGRSCKKRFSATRRATLCSCHCWLAMRLQYTVRRGSAPASSCGASGAAGGSHPSSAHVQDTFAGSEPQPWSCATACILCRWSVVPAYSPLDATICAGRYSTRQQVGAVPRWYWH